MSIVITNISEHDDQDGLNQYALRINLHELVRFDHVRSNGLSACLRRAADAFDAQHPRLSHGSEIVSSVEAGR